jgi:conjugative relaxase-like TrwC/TraI family protein
MPSWRSAKTTPCSGQRLTQRQNGVRTTDAERGVANRRVFYDFTFSPPKSVSIAALVTDDSRIIEAHGAAVKVALAELERFASATHPRCGKHSDRRTGNIVAALFQHETSRALDPHLHTHCIVFNATHDAEVGRWKAMQNYEMLAAQNTRRMSIITSWLEGARLWLYDLELGAWRFEITEVARELCARFSKRPPRDRREDARLPRCKPE